MSNYAVVQFIALSLLHSSKSLRPASPGSEFEGFGSSGKTIWSINATLVNRFVVCSTIAAVEEKLWKAPFQVLLGKFSTRKRLSSSSFGRRGLIHGAKTLELDNGITKACEHYQCHKHSKYKLT